MICFGVKNGLEDGDDLREDLDQALNRIP